MARLRYLPYLLTGIAVVVPLTVAFAPVGVGAAQPPANQDVTVKNTTANPVPIVGTVSVGNLPAVQAVSGTVSVGNLPAVQAVSGSVDVRTNSSDHTPYQQTIYFNQTSSACTQFVCAVSFPAVPAGQRLVIGYASAQYSLSSGGSFPSVELSVDGGDTPSILLPEPVHHGLDEYTVASPVTFYVDAGHHPTLLLEGQFVIPTSITAHASVTGYLVPAT